MESREDQAANSLRRGCSPPAPTAYFQRISLILHRFCNNLAARNSVVIGETSATIVTSNKALTTTITALILQEESTSEKIDQDYWALTNSTLGQYRFQV